ncbi:MAG: restriction endonuclease subunit S [Phycisphaerales bacterium]|nr:restriction endonuclease subunit S [Phycisphaerales bacterium]
MTGKTPRPLVPKLRFPEFEDAAEWEQRTMGNLGVFIRGLTYSAADVADAGLLVLRSSNIQDGRLVLDSDLVHVAKECPPDLLLREGDVAICMSNGSKALVGKHAEYRGGYEGEITVGAFCSIFRATNTFAKLAFATDAYSDFVALGIAGGNINNLKNADLEAFEFYVPRHREEQQKIADCLGSLDDLIAAESRKLDALRRHKQGLMQQLFPQPGESVPRLRFPEFEDAPAWEQKEIDALARVTQGGTPDTTNADYWGGPIYWLTPAEMGKDDSPYIGSTRRTLTEEGLEHCSSELLPPQSVIISTRAPIGHLAINTLPIAINQGCRGLIPVADARFLYYALLYAKPRLLDLGAGNTFKELSGSALKAFILPAPSPREQRKIADCLTSLDDLIAEEGRRLEALRRHKQGLMQQLFPRPEEEAR